MFERLNNTIPDFLLNPRFRIYRHLALQSVILLIAMNVLWDTPDKLLITPARLQVCICYFLLMDFIIYMNLYVALPRFLLKDKLFKYLISVISLVLFAVMAIGVMQTLIFETVDPSELSYSTPEVNNVNYAAILLGILSSSFAIIFLIFGISALVLFRHWLSDNQRIDDLRSATLQSELKLLKDQINPHFLFNMLNNANLLIRKRRPEASEVLFKLEDLLRYQINDSAQETVQLSSEIHFLNDFLNLEKIRRDNLGFTISKEGDINSVFLPPMLFIPFVENAVKHNPDSDKPSCIDISFKIRGYILEFRCTNSKPAMPAKRNAVGGLGLKNIRRRLGLLFPDRHILEIKEDESVYAVYLKLDLSNI